jgi:predicted DNA-binding transcriptional regulator YafY
MVDTSARLFQLLPLLQMPRDWSGTDLAERLGVTTRTVRRDIDRLRELGYPVHATMGPVGGYHLAAGTMLPPLLLDDDEAVAITVGLHTATVLTGHTAAGCECTPRRPRSPDVSTASSPLSTTTCACWNWQRTHST